jgi:hypothetical protein
MCFDYLPDANVGVSIPVLAAFASAWLTNMQISLLGVMSEDATLADLVVSEVALGTTPSVVSVVNLPATVAVHGYPTTVAACVSKHTALKGQHGRGRCYVPAVPLTFVTPATEPDTINNTGSVAYGLFASSLLTTVPAGGTSWRLAVATRPVPPVTLVTNAERVIALTLDLLLATVRRRREGRGI